MSTDPVIAQIASDSADATLFGRRDGRRRYLGMAIHIGRYR